MKTIVKILAVAASLLIVGAAFSSCKKDKKEETKPVPCFVYADNTDTPMPDELEISLSKDYELRFVPTDGTKPVIYDGSHPMQFTFDGASTGHDMFAWAGLSAEKFGLEGWCFGFSGKKSGSPVAKVGDTDMVTVIYDNDGITIMKRVKLIAVE